MSVSRTVLISSADDPRLADYTRLTDVGLRTHLEARHGLFIAEGTKVITRAVLGLQVSPKADVGQPRVVRQPRVVGAADWNRA